MRSQVDLKGHLKALACSAEWSRQALAAQHSWRGAMWPVAAPSHMLHLRSAVESMMKGSLPSSKCRRSPLGSNSPPMFGSNLPMQTRAIESIARHDAVPS